MQIGVTTAPRATVYLHRTLASLEDAGFPRDSVTIFAEPESVVPNGYKVTWRPTTFGILHNWLCGLREISQGDGVVAMVQDDLVCAEGLSDWLSAFPWTPRIGVVSPYCSAKDAATQGLFRITHKNPFGACFLAFPARVARAVVDSPLVPGWRGDRRIEQIVARSVCSVIGLEWWSVNPSYVQHVGDVGTDGRVGRAAGWLAAGDFRGNFLSSHTD